MKIRGWAELSQTSLNKPIWPIRYERAQEKLARDDGGKDNVRPGQRDISNLGSTGRVETKSTEHPHESVRFERGWGPGKTGGESLCSGRCLPHVHCIEEVAGRGRTMEGVRGRGRRLDAGKKREVQRCPPITWATPSGVKNLNSGRPVWYGDGEGKGGKAVSRGDTRRGEKN